MGSLTCTACAHALLTRVQVSWAAALPRPQEGESRFSLPHTDVTLSEGRCAATYYGMYATM